MGQLLHFNLNILLTMPEIIIPSSSPLYAPVHSKLMEIEKTLSEVNTEQDALYTGKAGIAIFYTSLYELTKEQAYLDKAILLIEEALDAIQNKELIYTYCGGFTGICWAVTHMVQKGYLDINLDELLEEIDNYAYEFAKTDLLQHRYDFMHNGLSTGIYFTDRPTSPFAQEKLPEIVDLLKAMATVTEDGTTWEDKYGKFSAQTFIPDYDVTKTEYNLGLSHGMPSILVFLQRCVQQGIHLAESKPLLEGAVNWLLKQAYPSDLDCYYGTKVIEGKTAPESSRLAWCYGDLGIMTTLWQCGNTLNNETVKQHAIAVALKAAKRTMENASTADAGICHGTAGIAHIFNRMYHYSGQAELKQAALYWFEKTLTYATFEDGYAGYKAYHGKEGFKTETSMLEGISGIGLTMISALDGDLDWDRMLLIS